MPATFESFGIKFLYPDNWTLSQRAEDEADEGATLELPGGGFFSIELEDEGLSDQEVFDRVAEAIKEEYHEYEMEPVSLPGADEDEVSVDIRFYYLDLLIVSRVVLLRSESGTLIVQAQAESRDFDANEQVFAAVFQQLRSA